MDVEIKIVKAAREKSDVIAIRRSVFIEEQNIPETIEIDANEDKASYVLAYADGNPVGTARWRETQSGIKLERFAVLKEYRSYGIGKQLTKFILNQIEGHKAIYLNAQESVIPFYENCGFKIVGEKFEEAGGISHQKMLYPKGE
ncbi:MAG: GNAT family N-acetyltransferase [Candidatus Marinimicrobia bacterium]|nr:GNAT family N-acetyltransferase [Candidatus Neomarinimicrobiota bacterium]